MSQKQILPFVFMVDCKNTKTWIFINKIAKRKKFLPTLKKIYRIKEKKTTQFGGFHKFSQVPWSFQETAQLSHLEASDDLSQRKSGLLPSNERGGGQVEDLVQVRLIQTVESCVGEERGAQPHGGHSLGKGEGTPQRREKRTEKS